MQSDSFDFTIYFASQTGTAEGFAKVFSNEAQKRGLKSEVVDLSETSDILFKKKKNKVMIMATHYEGNAPDNAEEFWSWFSQESEIPKDWLKGHQFTVFALGDQSYVNFAKIGCETDRLLEKYGATRIHKLGVGSDDEGKISSFFDEWCKSGVYDSVMTHFKSAKMEEENPNGSQVNLNPEATPEMSYSSIISSFHKEKSFEEFIKSQEEYNFKTRNYLTGHQRLRIVNISELRQNHSLNNFTKLIEITGFKGTYRAGDNIAFFPRNHKEKIERMKKLLNFTVDYVFTVKSNDQRRLPCPSPLGTDTFLSEFIDLGGLVKQTDMIRLRGLLNATDYAKYHLYHFRVKEARILLSEQNKDQFDLVDLFETAKIKVTLDLLINLEKRIEVIPTLNEVPCVHHSLFEPRIPGHHPNRNIGPVDRRPKNRPHDRLHLRAPQGHARRPEQDGQHPSQNL